MATTRARSPLQSRLKRFARTEIDLWIDCFGRHNLLTYASAIALRAFVALIPLTLLGLALLGAFGLEDVWTNSIAPALKHHFTPAVYKGVNSSVKMIFAHDSAGLIAFATLLVVWDVSSAVRACIGGIQAIYEQRDERSTWHRFGLSLGLGVAITLCLVGAVLVVVAAPTLSDGLLDALLGFLRWLVALSLLGLAVGLLVHFGPAKRRAEAWVGLGTVLVVATWAIASIVFRWLVGSVLDFRSATGVLAAFLVLTTYVYTSSIIFLVGVQLDELARKKAG